MDFHLARSGRNRAETEAAGAPSERRDEPFNLTLAAASAAKHDFRRLKTMMERSSGSEENVRKMKHLFDILEQTTDPETVRGAFSAFREAVTDAAA